MCNKFVLKKQLYSLRMEGGDVLGHVQQFDQLSMDLLNLGMTMEEEDKSLMLLCSLSGSYDPLVTTLLDGKEILVYKEIMSILRTNEQRERMMRGSMEVPQDAMVASERFRRKDRHEIVGRQSFSKSIREVRCYMCRQLGHMKRKYP